MSSKSVPEPGPPARRPWSLAARLTAWYAGSAFTLVLVATGSRPLHPPIFPFGAQGIFDSDTILQLEEVPHSLVVVGGGVIGCEYACTFAALGIPVTLVDP